MATITERFGFTKPAGNDPASIVPLNSNTDLIEQYLGRTQDMIAPLYDDTATYDVGDYAIYNNIVYECTTAVSTAEPFDSTKWTATSIEQIIDGVKGDVSQLNSSKANSILVRDVACNSFGTISANSVFEITANVAYSGYTPLGVVGYNFNDRSFKVSVTGTRIIGSTASILGRTLDSGIIDTDSATIRILYIKN
jgi:hypothetical protein